ncbi:OpgC family protein (plasmid) [Aquamicrobium terrae]
MTNPITNQRDTRIDVLRALALLTIFIDHVPGNMLDRLTYKNFGFSDAAEVFVLISGISVALAYEAQFVRGNRLKQILKLWRRASILYVAHIVISLGTIAIFCLGAVLTKRPDILTQINLHAIFTRTPETLIGIVTLGHQLGYNNILPVYAAVMLAAPLALWAASRWPVGTLTASGAVWLAAGIWQIAPRNYPEPGFWFMNPLSWQFLFAIGIVCTMHVRRGGTIPVRGWTVALAGVYVVLALVWVRTPLWGVVSWFGLPPVLGGFDKTFLSLSRLLHVLAVAYLVVSLCSVSSALRWSLDHPLVVLGRRSLPVFLAGTLLAMSAQVLRFIHGGGLLYDASLLTAGTMAQFLLAYYLDWQARLGKALQADSGAQPQGSFIHATVRN